MRAIAWDTWAFVEIALAKPRRGEAEELARDAFEIFTVPQVVVETFNLLVSRARRTEPAWAWWEQLRASRVRILDVSLEEVHEFMQGRDRDADLSLTDYSLALAAERVGTPEIATEDPGFRRLGLIPLFAGS